MFFTYWPDLGSTPARVNRFTGEIQLNMRYFNRMPEFHRRFIIEHEKGHYMLNTRSEFEADRFAFRRLAGSSPGSLKESVKSISRVLSFNNPEHLDRMRRVVIMALEHDFNINGNPRAKQALDQLNQCRAKACLVSSSNQSNHPMSTNHNPYFEPRYPESDYSGLYDYGSGKANRQKKKKERQDRKKEKQELKIEKKRLKNERYAVKTDKKQSKADLNRSRGYAKEAKADAKMELAEQGISEGNWFDKTLNTVGGIFGGGSGSADGAAGESSGKILGMPKGVAIAVAGVLLLIIGGVIFFVVRKRK